jgi:formate dehydrogenase subunit gamma
VATTRPADGALAADIASAAEPVHRFDAFERVVHWVNALLFLTLLVTGSCLFIPSLSAVVGRRELMKDVHVIAGLALPLPLVAAAVLAWLSRRSGLRVARGFAADSHELARFSRADRRWLRRLGRDGSIPVGKFNAGQKLNAAFIVGAVPVMLATGLMLRFPGRFENSLRTGATFVHDWMYLALTVVIIGHIAKALSDPHALKSMVTGDVPRWWARKHRAWRIDPPAATGDAGSETVS